MGLGSTIQHYLGEYHEVIMAISTFLLMLATVFLAISTQNMMEVSQSQANIEGFQADLNRPAPTCTWTRNDTVEIMVSNTGKSPFMISEISINGTFLFEGYYGYKNSTLAKITASHRVIPGEAHRRFLLKEDEMYHNIRGDQAQIRGIAQIRDIYITTTTGRPLFTDLDHNKRIRCREVPGVFLVPINED